MTALPRLVDALPPPYAVAADALLVRILDVFAMELDSASEDIDRLRQTHWIDTVYRLGDLEKLAALVDVERFSWEGIPTYRARIKALVRARLEGALGVRQIRNFVYDYLTEIETVLGCVFLPGIAGRGRQRLDAEAAYSVPPDRPHYRPLELVENPEKIRRSGTLLARGGRVPYLFRWEEQNRGLSPTVARFRIVGVSQQRTTVPILVNRTTGDLIGWRGAVPLGALLSIEPGEEPGRAIATLDGEDVTDRLFSMRGFRLGVPFEPGDLDLAPQLVRMDRGVNEFVYLSVGLFDVKGLNRFFYAIAGEDLREAVFDQTGFDRALFPSGTVANLALDWIETEPASFVVRVPRYLVSEPVEAVALSETRPYEEFEEGLRDAIHKLHAAGVRADVELVPFRETMKQVARLRTSFEVLPPDLGSAGEDAELGIGGRFGQGGLGSTRFN